MADDNTEGGDNTELFAHFGRAGYMANVLEMALAQTLLQVEFMTNVREHFIRTKGKDFDRKKYEDEFDEYFKEKLSKTMGQLGKLAKDSPELTDDLKGRINDAISRRNFLVHDYWRESGDKLWTEGGRAEMIAELSIDTATFEKLAADILEATKPVRKRLGISEEKLNERVELRMAELRLGMSLD
jgi:hypothetical protein